MSPMALKIQTLYPELIVTLVAFAVMILGLSKSEAMRRATYPISVFGLLAAIFLAGAAGAMGIEHVAPIAAFMKVAICAVGVVLLAAAAEVPDEAGGEQVTHSSAAQFDPAHTSRGEFFGFMLLSLVGAMLCAGADDLIWLFLALELTSLPTYVMVAISRKNIRAPEAGVKYFFLGAMAAAIFLYGFALIYAGTGTTYVSEIAAHVADPTRGFNGLIVAGVLLSILGLCFKIAAVPMHMYVADVYQGAATPVTAFLAFVPKAAGFIALIVLIAAVGWPGGGGTADAEQTRHGFVVLLWVLAVVTMFAGNTLALLQSNVKRVLAYSSIAHSGYMLVGLVAGPGLVAASTDKTIFVRNGVGAVLFYLVAYGVMNLGAFAVLALLRRQGEEAETYDDLRGLVRRRPGLAAIMAVCVLSLTGIPPLVGFWGKAYIIGAAFNASGADGPMGDAGWMMVLLGVLALVNSAIAAYYYLHIFGVCFLSEPTGETEPVDDTLPSRSLAAWGAAVGVVVLSLATGPLMGVAYNAAVGYETKPASAADGPSAATPIEPASASSPASAAVDR